MQWYLASPFEMSSRKLAHALPCVQFGSDTTELVDNRNGILQSCVYPGHLINVLMIKKSFYIHMYLCGQLSFQALGSVFGGKGPFLKRNGQYLPAIACGN